MKDNFNSNFLMVEVNQNRKENGFMKVSLKKDLKMVEEN